MCLDLYKMTDRHDKALEKFMNAEIGDDLTELQEAVGLTITSEALTQAKLNIIIGVIHSEDFDEIMRLSESMPPMITGAMQ